MFSLIILNRFKSKNLNSTFYGTKKSNSYIFCNRYLLSENLLQRSAIENKDGDRNGDRDRAILHSCFFVALLIKTFVLLQYTMYYKELFPYAASFCVDLKAFITCFIVQSKDNMLFSAIMGLAFKI